MADDDLSQFEPEPGAEFVWMIHEGGTVPAEFPIASVQLWRLKGWKPCAAPPDVDPALVERVLPPAPAPVLVPADVEADDTDDTEGVTEDA